MFTKKMEMLFPQLLVQVHRIPSDTFDQYFYRMESLFVLKQSSCKVFFVKGEYG